MLNLPKGWAAPKFQFGQTVFVEATSNEPYIVVGARYAPYRHCAAPLWYYTLADADDLTSLFHVIFGHVVEESEISAEPWPIEGEFCPGIQHPCGKPAAYWSGTWTGNDMETARPVDLAYCPECWKEIQRIKREAVA